jgi:hypothetical protein
VNKVDKVVDPFKRRTRALIDISYWAAESTRCHHHEQHSTDRNARIVIVLILNDTLLFPFAQHLQRYTLVHHRPDILCIIQRTRLSDQAHHCLYCIILAPPPHSKRIALKGSILELLAA